MSTHTQHRANGWTHKWIVWAGQQTAGSAVALIPLMVIGVMATLISPGWADTSMPPTLDTAIQTALQNNPKLQAARLKLDVSDAQVVTAGARLNPSLVSDNGLAEKPIV